MRRRFSSIDKLCSRYCVPFAQLKDKPSTRHFASPKISPQKPSYHLKLKFQTLKNHLTNKIVM